jgi:HSP20 family protein
MLMRYWQPFTEIETIRQQLDKAFDQLAATRDNSETAWMPALEFADAGDNFVLRGASLARTNTKRLCAS